MTPRMVLSMVALFVLAAPLAAQRWQMQYLYDEAKSALAISDIQFPTPSRGVAAGVINSVRGQKPITLVTSDGGAHWRTVPLKENPVSLFFLNENIGWMVTEKGLWRTDESGNSWTKLPKVPAPAVRVHFADEKTGWAACAGKTVLETHDGAQHWSTIAASLESPSGKYSTTFNWIMFANPQFGLITGASIPPQRAALPPWLDPASVLLNRDLPHFTFTLQTTDGGKTWRPASTVMYGEVTRARFGPQGRGLVLVESSLAFDYPSVFQLPWPPGKEVISPAATEENLIFRHKAFYVTDIWATPDGTYYLAGTVFANRIPGIVPQKVMAFRSRDLKEWTSIPLDYRAVANRAYFAGAGENDLWIATNNGMILKLTP